MNMNEKSNDFSLICFIVLCFFLGNDFIPHLSYLSIKHDGIETLIDIYANISRSLNIDIIEYKEQKPCLNFVFIQKMFELLSLPETLEIQKIDEKYYKKTYQINFI